MSKRDDTCLRPRPALFEFGNRRLAAQRIADKHWIRHDQFIVRKVRDQHSKRGIGDGHAYHQTEGENAVDQNAAELTCRRSLRVKVQRLRVVSQHAYQ